ncbi:MAG: hypothetical protein QOE54_3203 [Streptosporangiaceae bacterium]|nr:hypothetical protein [Streptosporangiaceae bacterium]MDX6430837.1 hypothetical protein [Streptosporangiaceae bacterium]
MSSHLDLTSARWRKSVRSAANEACVEVAPLDRIVAVRDSKHPDGPSLMFSGHAWSAFLSTVKEG